MKNVAIQRYLAYYCGMKKISAFTMMEVLGVVGVVLVLAAVAIPSYKSTNQGAKVSVALRNMSTLNDAVQQYDEAGGLMTAEVIVPANVGALTNKADLPEMKVLNRLRDAGRTETGEVVSSWQEPIFDTKGNRVVWVNGLSQAEANQTTKTISGMRNPVAEAKMKSGQGGMFTMIGPDAGRMGIVGFVENNLTVAGTPTPTPTPAVTMYSVSLSLSSPAAGAITGNGSYKAGSTANISVILNPGWKVGSWDAATTQLLGSSKSTKGSFAVTGNVTGTLTVERADVTVNLSVSPLSAGTVTGGGNYKYGANVPYTLTVNPGWAFKSWSRAGMAQNGTINNVMSDINATATMQLVDYILTMQSAQGGSANLAPGAYKYKLNDEVPLVATPIWSTTWNSPRYRWDKWTVGTTTQTNSAFTHVMTAPVIIKPNFIQQYRYEYVEPPVNGHMGTAASDKPNGIYDMGTQIKLTSTVAPENKTKYRLKQWLQSTDAGGTTWSPLNSSASYTHSLSADIRIKAEFTDKFSLSAKVIDAATGAPAPANALVLNGISLTPVDLPMYSDVEFTAVPQSGWTLVSASSDSFTQDARGQRLYGGTGKHKLAADTEIIIKVARRELVEYWNESVPAGGNIYPASIIQSSGVSFVAARDKNKISAAQVSNLLGAVAISYYTDAYAGSITGSWSYHYVPPRNDDDKRNNTHLSYQTAPTYNRYTRTTYTSQRSANAVILDGVSGDYVTTVPYIQKYSLGAVVPNTGQIVGTAYGNLPYNSSQSTYDVGSGTAYKASPVMVDLNCDGIPNLLSGGDWKSSPDRRLSGSALREFNLDGTGKKLWEWVAKDDGLLVYNPGRQSAFDVTGHDLFGNFTFGKEWKNGYEALATLDLNSDNLLSGEELADIYIWKDENEDAQVQQGELLPASNYKVDYILCSPTVDDSGNSMVAQGIQFAREGMIVAPSTWDWISLGGLDPSLKQAEAYRYEISSFGASGSGQLNGANLSFAPVRVEGKEGKADSLPYAAFWCVPPSRVTKLNAPVTVSGNIIEWIGPLIDKNLELVVAQNVATISKDGKTLEGKSTINGKIETWTAELYMGLPLNLLPLSQNKSK